MKIASVDLAIFAEAILVACRRLRDDDNKIMLFRPYTSEGKIDVKLIEKVMLNLLSEISKETVTEITPNQWYQLPLDVKSTSM
jgi:hypothetical protein